MPETCRCRDFELRGMTYELWHDSHGNYLVSTDSSEVVDTGRAFDPPLSNDELLRIDGYGLDY